MIAVLDKSSVHTILVHIHVFYFSVGRFKIHRIPVLPRSDECNSSGNHPKTPSPWEVCSPVICLWAVQRCAAALPGCDSLM